ncbi:receptor-like protein 13 [Diospyros lotus]|uniref:receptor-like protein 13 n=1 Tax=Diospyros lotus TaxID=55363 RepID=UPI00224E4351|nr:receptor-like protein 13 [Diospyros lotus]XP_052176129.1 receptor-like protein 13 [Diospyros lotus]
MGTSIDLNCFKRLLKLINLKVLDLSHNLFNDTIFEFVGEISSLRSLSLAANFMGISIDWNNFKSLLKLINLKVLDLSYNLFNDTILDFVGKISSLRSLSLANNYMETSIDLNSFKRPSKLINLKVLDLSYNFFNCTIWEFVGEILSLRSLSLANNYNTGTSIDLNNFKRLSKLINLEVLDLSYNQLNNTILEFVGEISSLRSLSLAYNDMGTSIDLNSKFTFMLDLLLQNNNPSRIEKELVMEFSIIKYI